MKTDDEEETDGVADPPDVDAATTEAVGADEFSERAKAIAIWMTPMPFG